MKWTFGSTISRTAQTSGLFIQWNMSWQLSFPKTVPWTGTETYFWNGFWFWVLELELRDLISCDEEVNLTSCGFWRTEDWQTIKITKKIVRWTICIFILDQFKLAIFFMWKVNSSARFQRLLSREIYWGQVRISQAYLFLDFLTVINFEKIKKSLLLYIFKLLQCLERVFS